MSDGKKGNTEATLLGLPEVGAAPTNSTQVMDETVRDPNEANGPIESPTGASLLDSTAPSLQPVPSPPSPVVSKPPVTTAPPRTKTGGVRTSDTLNDAPRSKSSGAVPKPPEANKPRPSRIAVKAQADVADAQTDPSRRKPVMSDAAPVTGDLPDPNASTDPGRSLQTAVTNPSSKPVGPKFEWTMPRVAGITGGVCLLFIIVWVVWPSGKAAPRNTRPERDEVVEDLSAPKPLAQKAPPKPVAAPVKPKSDDKPVFALDSKNNVIDPYGVHMEDQPLDPAHKYRLRIERDDSRLGTALARLDEKEGWGVVRKMASHAALQFGGAKALRLHCEPGKQFSEGQFFPLELTDMATKKSVPINLNPATHCWDFEMMRTMGLGEGVKKRLRVPTDSTVKLGEGVPLKVAYVLEALGEKKEWRTGVLNPGESVLAEGRLIRFGVLDPYAADNEGTVDLEILSGDTESSGLVTPSSASGAEFVPTNK